MDSGEVFVFLLFLFFVVVLPILNKLFGKQRQTSPELSADTSSAPPRRAGLLASLEEALRQAALEAEKPVPSEHTRTPGEHQRTAAEHRRTATEHRRTVAETRRTASEHRRTPSEQQSTLSEHRPTAGEHTPGDLSVSRAPMREKRRRSRSGFADSVFAELRGSASLCRGMVLREILSPPVSLRTPPQGGVG